MYNVSTKFLFSELSGEDEIANCHISLFAFGIYPEHAILEFNNEMTEHITDCLALFVIHTPIATYIV